MRMKRKEGGFVSLHEKTRIVCPEKRLHGMMLPYRLTDPAVFYLCYDPNSLDFIPSYTWFLFWNIPDTYKSVALRGHASKLNPQTNSLPTRSLPAQALNFFLLLLSFVFLNTCLTGSLAIIPCRDAFSDAHAWWASLLIKYSLTKCKRRFIFTQDVRPVFNEENLASRELWSRFWK